MFGGALGSGAGVPGGVGGGSVAVAVALNVGEVSGPGAVLGEIVV